MSDRPIACTLEPGQLRERLDGLLGRLAALASERQLLDDGVVLRFESAAADLPLLLQVLQAERQCCRFLTFRLAFEPELGPITLEMTGPPGTREFLEGTLGL
jgi:hypothetical protein